LLFQQWIFMDITMILQWYYNLMIL
jgi:hypothetical protein